ncbi:lipopolysaccharide biosynthesis protein [Pacificimonas flava]|uniref:lipopolysaccharide biosynthesis protein n=1 Tax=Pacificimonas flava TaxID=1234595 RepID=UPI001850F074|nr:oligosaccharide flippase family protein [Pacificimonas flava]MBB5280966.1 O-antigen/teichoic acid export membrane protein [Pacificimonas flava]
MSAADPSATPAARGDDTKALAKGGRTNFVGFLLRLMGRIPFLIIGGQIYGAEALGRFAYATMIVELMAAVATLGLRRGIAAELAKEERPATHVIGDALLLGTSLALAGAAILIAVPELLFPNSKISGLDRLFPLAAVFFVATEVLLAALAYRHNVQATVTARALIEPWAITIAAAGLALVPEWRPDALIISYAFAMFAALIAAMIPALRMFGLPQAWRPRPRELFALMRQNWPLAGADAADWAMRRIDIIILGQFAAPAVLGVYYVAQQFASLPQKLKVTFDPVLAPVIAHGVRDGDLTGVAQQLRQVGFWIISAQLGIALILGFTGEASMEVIGDGFGAGTGILFLLLGAEVLYVTAAVTEGALVYMARHRNLLVSLIALGAQVAMTVAFVASFAALFPNVAADRPVQGIGAALALALAALLASVLKVALMHRLIPDPVSGWRWVFLPVTVATSAAGFASMTFLPPFWQLTVGLPVLLTIYGSLMWFFAFKGPDRLLFSKLSEAKGQEEEAEELGVPVPLGDVPTRSSPLPSSSSDGASSSS